MKSLWQFVVAAARFLLRRSQWHFGLNPHFNDGVHVAGFSHVDSPIECLCEVSFPIDRISNSLLISSTTSPFIPRILQITPRFISPMSGILPLLFLLGLSRGQVVPPCRCPWAHSSNSRTAAGGPPILSVSPHIPILLPSPVTTHLFLSSSTPRPHSSSQRWQLRLLRLFLRLPLSPHPLNVHNTPSSSRRSTSHRRRSCWRSCLCRRKGWRR